MKPLKKILRSWWEHVKARSTAPGTDDFQAPSRQLSHDRGSIHSDDTNDLLASVY